MNESLAQFGVASPSESRPANFDANLASQADTNAKNSKNNVPAGPGEGAS